MAAADVSGCRERASQMVAHRDFGGHHITPFKGIYDGGMFFDDRRGVSTDDTRFCRIAIGDVHDLVVGYPLTLRMPEFG